MSRPSSPRHISRRPAGWRPAARAALGLLALIVGLAACAPGPAGQAGPAPTPPPLASAVILGDGRPSELPAVAERRARLAAALAAPPYILQREGLTGAQAAAQAAALADERVQAAARTPDGQRLRAEVMAVGEASAGDVPAALAQACRPGRCVRVQVYVYPTNTTVTALVSDGAVLDVQSLAGAQPEIPADLADLATQIAIAAPQVAQAFDGLTPDAAMAAMSATKTALADTSCERSRHLCVAPVFTWGAAALWTIVDLTELRLVAATTWTEQGATGRRVFSEATLQDAALAPLCETPRAVERDGWSLSYLLTSSDGLELRDVRFQGRPVLASAKVVDWHVGYAGQDDRRVGFSDAVGCPVFSAAAVVPYGPPTVEEAPGGGFTLAITFRSPNWPQPCNYQYTLRADFAPDGAMRLVAGNEGRGCGTEGVYHPVLRLEPPAGARAALLGGAAPAPLAEEGQAEWLPGGPEALRIEAGGAALTMAPVWGDAELAYLYWTRPAEAEGRGDLPSIGSCCALDARQGPEQFIGPGAPEPLDDGVVIWLVPRIRNAERERCWADTALVDGVLVPEIWPCGAGVDITQGAP